MTPAGRAEALVDALGVAGGGGVEYEQGLAALLGGGLGGLHQCSAEAPTARAAMNEKLRQVAAMGLVVGHVEDELHGAADALGVVREEEEALAGGEVARHAHPECDRSFAREQMSRAVDDVSDDMALFVSFYHAVATRSARQCAMTREARRI